MQSAAAREPDGRTRRMTISEVFLLAVTLYFGLPGCGKTTMMTALALKGVKDKRYTHVYCNVHVCVPGVTYIDNACIGLYDLHDCLILIDEATLFADNRDYKNFSKERITYFLEHRHFNCDMILFTQQWDGVDRKIRVITDRVYYVYKGKLLGKWFTRCYRVPYGIIIPDPKKTSSEKLGEIVQGYCKPNPLVRLFSPWLYRPRYYRYFDSWERPQLPPLPAQYQPYVAPVPDQEPKILDNGQVLEPYFDKNGDVKYRLRKEQHTPRLVKKGKGFLSHRKDKPEGLDAAS